MTGRFYLAVFIFVLAPIAAAVVITVLLLFGAPPAIVFAPGHALIAFFANRGVHVPKQVGVLTTAALWWQAIVILGLTWDRWREKR